MKIDNTKHRFGETNNYIFVRINGVDALFTPDAVRVAQDRARQQPEDVPGFWKRLNHWFKNI